MAHFETRKETIEAVRWDGLDCGFTDPPPWLMHAFEKRRLSIDSDGDLVLSPLIPDDTSMWARAPVWVVRRTSSELTLMTEGAFADRYQAVLAEEGET